MDYNSVSYGSFGIDFVVGICHNRRRSLRRPVFKTLGFWHRDRSFCSSYRQVGNGLLGNGQVAS